MYLASIALGFEREESIHRSQAGADQQDLRAGMPIVIVQAGKGSGDPWRSEVRGGRSRQSSGSRIAGRDYNFVCINNVPISQCEACLKTVVRERGCIGIVLAESAARLRGADGRLKKVLKVGAEEFPWCEKIGSRDRFAVGVKPVEEVHGLGTKRAHAYRGHIEKMIVPDRGVGQTTSCGAWIDQIDVYREITAKKMNGDQRAAEAATNNRDAQRGLIRIGHPAFQRMIASDPAPAG